MKATMRRQKEETDAKNAALKQQRGPLAAGRPGPAGARPTGQSAPAIPPAPVEKFTDMTNLPALWTAVRNHLQGSARYLESVLGHSCRIDEFHPITGETFLSVPESQKGFTNEKARAKIEESLRAITGLGIRLAMRFVPDETPAPNTESSHSGAGAHSTAARRIPPEVIDAIKNQPVIQQLMKRLDATVVHIEMLTTDDA